MHEFILYSQVAASRHSQVTNILAGITASQPVNVSEQILVYQQLKMADATGPRKGHAKQGVPVQQPSHHKLVRSMDNGGRASEWQLRLEEVPEPGIKSVTSRTVLEREAAGADLERFGVDSGWYKSVSNLPKGVDSILTYRRLTAQLVAFGKSSDAVTLVPVLYACATVGHVLS